jgi:hypothetical protein
MQPLSGPQEGAHFSFDYCRIFILVSSFSLGLGLNRRKKAFCSCLDFL